MFALAIISWTVPMVVAITVGLRRGRRPAHSPSEFSMDVAYMLMSAGPIVFIFHMLWLGSLMMQDGGVAELGRWSWYWTWLTGLAWVPLMIISYIVKAMRSRA